MQFVQEYKCLDDHLQSDIIQILKQDSRPFDKSMIYDSLKDEKEIVQEERMSVFKTFTDKELFNKCEKLVDLINIKNKFLDFLLVKNDVTFIKYSQGGFFKPHSDYLSITSNMIQEYTLLMCVDAECKGGETVLHLNEHFSHPSKATVTPLHILLFRKDIRHEGALITKGYKEIMSLNLWAISKESDRMIIVNIEKDNKTFIIPINNVLDSKLPNNVLKSFVSFQDRMGSKKRILKYEEKNYSAEAFNIIFKLYLHHSIQSSEFHKYQEIIDYYGFNWKQLLIKNLIDNYDISSEGKAKEEFIKELIPSKNQEKKEKDDDNLILSGTYAKHVEFLEIVKKDLLPYVPFRIIFAEGNLSYGGGMSDYPSLFVKMTPVYMDISENHDVYFIQNLVTKDEVSDANILDFEDDLLGFNEIKYKKGLSVNQQKAKKNFKKLKDGDEFTISCDNDKYAIPMTDFEDLNDAKILKMNLNSSFKNKLTQIIPVIVDWKYSYSFNYDFIKSGEVTDVLETTDQYIITHDLKLRINQSQKHKLCCYLNHNFNDLKNQIIDKLNTLKFALPQETDKFDHSFCNENVYGNFNFLMVYGFLRYN